MKYFLLLVTFIHIYLSPCTSSPFCWGTLKGPETSKTFFSIGLRKNLYLLLNVTPFCWRGRPKRIKKKRNMYYRMFITNVLDPHQFFFGKKKTNFGILRNRFFYHVLKYWSWLLGGQNRFNWPHDQQGQDMKIFPGSNHWV